MAIVIGSPIPADELSCLDGILLLALQENAGMSDGPCPCPAWNSHMVALQPLMTIVVVWFLLVASLGRGRDSKSSTLFSIVARLLASPACGWCTILRCSLAHVFTEEKRKLCDAHIWNEFADVTDPSHILARSETDKGCSSRVSIRDNVGQV